jgi:hypothetical protein
VRDKTDVEQFKFKVMKVKIFEFRVSIGNGSNLTGAEGCWAKNWEDNAHKLTPTKQQEKEINKFLEKVEKDGGEVVNINENVYTYSRHNNGGCDSVIVRYTIIYK